MDVTWSQILEWLIVGAIAGSLAGMAVKRRREGFGPFLNTGIGLAGVLIGVGIFEVFDIDLPFGEVAISVQSLVASFLGALLFIGAVWLIRLTRSRRSE